MLRKIFTVITLALPLVAFGFYNPGTPRGYINDFVGMLSTDQSAVIEQKLSQFEKDTSNEITVVTIASLEGDTIEDFAVKLFEQWRIGKAKNDNGILLLIARDDRKMRIETGYGLEGALPDATASSIINNIIKPAFQNGDYAGGINGAVDAMISATKGEYQSSTASNGDGSMSAKNIENIFWIGFVAIIWLSSILARSKSWWAGGVVGGALGTVIGFIFGFLYFGIISMMLLIPLGLLFDFIVSRTYERGKAAGHIPWFIGGGGRGGFGGGGFGGFGGGHSGGGGSSGSW